MSTASSQITENQLTQSPAGNTFLGTCFNGMNTLLALGLGMVSVPYALSKGGWVSLIILILIATIYFYIGLLLRKCMDTNDEVTTYPAIGQEAFGRTGRFIVTSFMYLELFLSAVEFLTMEGDHLQMLFPIVSFDILGLKLGGKQCFVLAAALVVLPTTCLRNLGVLALVSAGGVLASMAVFVVFYDSAFEGIGTDERNPLLKSLR